MVPTRTGKPGKWESIFQPGNFTQKTGKIRKCDTGKLKKKILEICQSEKVGTVN